MKIVVYNFLSLLLVTIVLLKSKTTNAISVRVSNLTIGRTAYNLINSNIEDIYRVVYNSTNTTLNVTAWTNATPDLPLLIVIRQERGLISLQIPNNESFSLVQSVSRILCPAYVGSDSANSLSTVYIDIYTSSTQNISYSLHVTYFQSFILSEKTTTNIFVSPFAPVFFKYDMKYESSIVKFTSRDRICTTVSVQRMMCPVFDLKHTVDFAGQYQTMTQLAAISVDNPSLMHKSMYIVVSVHPTDRDCCDTENCSGSSLHRIKNLTIQLSPGYDHSTVNLNYAITLSVFLAIYVFICPFLCFVEPYCEKNFKPLIDEFKTIQTTFTCSTAVTPTSNNNRLFECLNEKFINSTSNTNTTTTNTTISTTTSHHHHHQNGPKSDIKPTAASGADSLNNSFHQETIHSLFRFFNIGQANSNVNSGNSTPTNGKSKKTPECKHEQIDETKKDHHQQPVAAKPPLTKPPTDDELAHQNKNTNNNNIHKPQATGAATATAPHVDNFLSIQIPKIQISHSKLLNNRKPKRHHNKANLVYSPQISATLTTTNNTTKPGNEPEHDYENHENLLPSLGLNSTNLNNLSSASAQIEDNSLATEDNSFSSSEYDKIEDAESYKEVVRNKRNLKVHDLARKQPKLLDRKIMNYPRLIIAIATFYVLPVIQLVLLYQTQLTKSGNEDSCYFNFMCMIKSGPFAAFNNVFSNVGYILLGIMFIIVVKKRSYSYTYMRKKYPIIMANHGIPQHFGLFYTMGIGLVMEGILSAAYHVCPSFNNFQFDTSFMYIVGVISTIKLYQCRHPDIHPSSQKVFLFLALCILLNVIGVFYGKVQTWFVISYTIGHVCFFFSVSVIIYYMKQPKLGLSALKEMAQKFKQDKNLTQPVHLDRLVMLIIANIFNVTIAVYGILFPTQFSSYLLNVLLGNFMLYFMMYLVNKILNQEKFHIITIVNLTVSTIAWIAALYFFKTEIKQWEKKPAESREANKSCILLNVYDHHDAWHFLSALSMFMSFVVILTLDDGIILTKRSEIVVF